MKKVLTIEIQIDEHSPFRKQLLSFAAEASETHRIRFKAPDGSVRTNPAVKVFIHDSLPPVIYEIDALEDVEKAISEITKAPKLIEQAAEAKKQKEVEEAKRKQQVRERLSKAASLRDEAIRTLFDILDDEKAPMALRQAVWSLIVLVGERVPLEVPAKPVEEQE